MEEPDALAACINQNEDSPRARSSIPRSSHLFPIS
jgi:hypothetical protein